MKMAKEKNSAGKGFNKFGEGGRIVTISDKGLSIKYWSKNLKSARR